MALRLAGICHPRLVQVLLTDHLELVGQPFSIQQPVVLEHLRKVVDSRRLHQLVCPLHLQAWLPLLLEGFHHHPTDSHLLVVLPHPLTANLLHPMDNLRLTVNRQLPLLQLLLADTARVAQHLQPWLATSNRRPHLDLFHSLVLQAELQHQWLPPWVDFLLLLLALLRLLVLPHHLLSQV